MHVYTYKMVKLICVTAIEKSPFVYGSLTLYLPVTSFGPCKQFVANLCLCTKRVSGSKMSNIDSITERISEKLKFENNCQQLKS